MKNKQISVLIFSLLLASCSVVKSLPSTPVKLASTVRPTSTLWPTQTSLPTSTPIPTPMPISSEISCEPTTNPFPTQNPNGNYLFHENFSIGKVCSFFWEIKRGQSFQKKITEGLVFCIEPSSFLVENGGWTINISDETGKTCDDNFAGIVTPPFRGGYNAIFIQGWQYRNENNTEPSVPTWLTTNPRIFNFVFNQKDYEAFFNNAFNIPTDNPVNLNDILTSRGVFAITNLELGNLIPNETPWIEEMKFEVKIYLPPD